jgi:hypothetical protein
MGKEKVSTEVLIFQFDRPHKPGTVCGFPCEQCGAGRVMGISLHGKRVADVPMLILGSATQDEWLANIAANGGDPSQAWIEPTAHYYRVSMD